MRILHLGWGFKPWAWGGYIDYVEDLMLEQAKVGNEVAYFFSGRSYPWQKKVYLNPWLRSKSVTMFEIVNSPIKLIPQKGISCPEFEISEVQTEKLFQEVIEKFKPQLVHFHTILGFPSSLIEIAKNNFKLPIIYTPHDKSPMCPNSLLFDQNNQFCENIERGKKCVECAHLKQVPNSYFSQTIFYDFRFLGSYFLRNMFYPWLSLAWGKLNNFHKQPSQGNEKDGCSGSDSNALSEAYLIRRTVNQRRFNLIDFYLCPSHRVQELYHQYFPSHANMQVLTVTSGHISYLKPATTFEMNPTIKLITLGGFASVPKGADFMMQVVKKLKEQNLDSRIEIHIWGWVSGEIRKSLEKFNNIILHGIFQSKQLPRILKGMHVGLIPSVCEDSFPLVGLEYLAAGIPIIGNNAGGIPEYTIDGKTGWLNKSNSVQGFVDILKIIIQNPNLILERRNHILENRSKYIKTMREHADEVQFFYEDALSKDA